MTILISEPLLSAFVPFTHNVPAISTPCDPKPSYDVHCHPAHPLQRHHSMLLSLTPPILSHTLNSPNKEILFTTLALSSYHPSFLLPCRKKIQNHISPQPPGSYILSLATE